MKRFFVTILLLSIFLSLHSALLVSAEDDTQDFSNLMRYYSNDFILKHSDLFGITDLTTQTRNTNGDSNTDVWGFEYQIEHILTPNGSTVEVWNYIDELTESRKEISEMYNESNYDATMEYEATLKYNCHSFAWYNNTPYNTYWMPCPDVYYNQSDMSYIEIYTDIRPGDIVCYYNALGENIHSGIVTHVDNNTVTNDYNDLSLIEVKSKWGSEGVYNHRGDICPYTHANPDYSTFEEEKKLVFSTHSIKFYRPRTESAHQLNSEMTDLSLSKSVSSNNGIQNTYSMYELNVTQTSYYEFLVSSNSEMNILLYDEHMQEFCTLNYEETSNVYTFALDLPCGIYYLRSEYSNETHNGTISVKVKYHDEHTYIYTSVDSEYHVGECVHCGYETDESMHVWRDYSSTHVVCRDCGLLKRQSGFIPIIKGLVLHPETE